MISSGYKKLAQEYGMTCASGTAYGSLRGYAVTFLDGMNIKTLSIAARFDQPEELEQIEALVSDKKIKKQYLLENVQLSPYGIEFVFQDTIGTLKRIRSFIDWFWPILEQTHATRSHICTECGLEVTQPCWKLVGDFAYPMHPACAERMERNLREEEQQAEEADQSSYATGAVGAFLGALLGAVVWGAVLMMGYMAALVGLLIGWLSIKGYTLFHGKRGKGMILIVLLALIFGVVAGTLGADAFVLGRMIHSGELPGFVYGDIPSMMYQVMTQDPAYRDQLGRFLFGGVGFALLGAGGMLYGLAKGTAKAKIKDLP